MRRPSGRSRSLASVLVLLPVAAALLSLRFRRQPSFVDGPLPVRSQSNVIRHASTIEGDEFKAARDRIRRIQLGLGPNDPLPEEDDEIVEAEPEVVPGPATGKLDLAEAEQPATPAKVDISGNVTTTDAKEASEDVVVQDAFAGTEKDVPELQPEVSDKEKKKGPNIFVALFQDLQVVTLPTPTEVAQTFGIVLLLVGGYTGFIAVVDFTSQQALGQVFADFYKAARPEAPQL
mmetsp:Transcript_1272/g.1730  ORF Transcript_1272/g.1730 Transcript_1272/m.1730 type:complete len:233 (-) Transcript_1272:58-756(-)